MLEQKLLSRNTISAAIFCSSKKPQINDNRESSTTAKTPILTLHLNGLRKEQRKQVVSKQQSTKQQGKNTAPWAVRKTKAAVTYQDGLHFRKIIFQLNLLIL
eukprot:10209662-Ditylum_brightwellii.AAC.1